MRQIDIISLAFSFLTAPRDSKLSEIAAHIKNVSGLDKIREFIEYLDVERQNTVNQRYNLTSTDRFPMEHRVLSYQLEVYRSLLAALRGVPVSFNLIPLAYVALDEKWLETSVNVLSCTSVIEQRGNWFVLVVNDYQLFNQLADINGWTVIR